MVLIQRQVPALPVWQRERVPVEEFCQWVVATGASGGVEKLGLYLLGEVVNAYSWEQEATWVYRQLLWCFQVGAVASILGEYEALVNDLRCAVRPWEAVVRWGEQLQIEALVPWLDGIAQRKQLLLEACQQFCQECAAWCEQQGVLFPSWLQVELGLVQVPQEQKNPDHYSE